MRSVSDQKGLVWRQDRMVADGVGKNRLKAPQRFIGIEAGLTRDPVYQPDKIFATRWNRQSGHGLALRRSIKKPSRARVEGLSHQDRGENRGGEGRTRLWRCRTRAVQGAG